MAIEPVSNDGAETVTGSAPYIAHVRLTGTTAMLFHRWSVEAIEAKSKAAKNSTAKKTDDLEASVYRLSNGNLGLPGENVRQSIILAAKFRQDPRSPRKSAMDLFKAGVITLTDLADLGRKDWDYVDQRRAQVQRQGITRRRPAMGEGWVAEFDFLVNLPEYIAPRDLRETIEQAGRLVGVCDFRPTYGRFAVTKFEVGTQ